MQTPPATCVADTLRLSQLHAHPRDRHIVFDDEPHDYYIRGSKDGWTSVTTFIHHFFKPFQGRLIATRMVRSRHWPTAEKYAQYRPLLVDAKTQKKRTQKEMVQAVLDSWDANGKDASEKGTRLHQNIEFFYNDVEVADSTPEYQHHFMDFAAVAQILKLKPFRTEWTIYGETEMICGSIDMIMQDADGKLHMFDWKRSKAIRFKGYGKGLNVCAHLQDCNFTHYSLQLNLYTFLLEKYYDVQISSMAIVVFHPNNPTFQLHNITRMSAQIQKMIEY